MAEIIKPIDFPVFNNLRPLPETEEPKAAVEEGNGVIPQTVVIDPLEDLTEKKEEEVVVQEVVQEEVRQESTEEFDAASYFNLATTLGVLEIPEDFQFDEKDPEGSILKAAEYTAQINYAKAEQALLAEVQDKNLAGLIQHGIEGGKFADLEKYFSATKQEIDFEKIDLDKEENQIKVYKEYLKGTGRFTEDKINRFIDALQEEDGLLEEAQKAKDYFIQEAKSVKENLTKQAAEQNKAEQRLMQERQDQFMSTLTNSGFSKPQQQKILNSFNAVELDNGRKVRAFEKTLMEVQANPKHYIEFLVLLDEYDKEKGFTFKKAEKQKETEITKSVLEKLKEAAPNLGKGKTGSIEDRPIIPRENPYVKNIARY